MYIDIDISTGYKTSDPSLLSFSFPPRSRLVHHQRRQRHQRRFHPDSTPPPTALPIGIDTSIVMVVTLAPESVHWSVVDTVPTFSHSVSDTSTLVCDDDGEDGDSVSESDCIHRISRLGRFCISLFSLTDGLFVRACVRACLRACVHA